MKFWIAAGLAALSLSACANASEILTFTQTGGNVVLAASGSVNTTGLTALGPFIGAISGVASGSAYAAVGAASFSNGSSPTGSGFRGFTGPSSFGTGGFTVASSSDGQLFLLYTSMNELFLPNGYTSGSSISGTSTFNGATFASLGLTPGTYLYTLPSDTVTVQIGPAATTAAPEPSSVALLGTGLLGVAGLLRRKIAKSI